MKCPNCQSGDFQNLCCSNLDTQRLACSECGTRWWEDGSFEPIVPRRSQPVEPLELPDGPGWWWCGFPPEKLIQVWERNGRFYLSCRTGDDPLPRGQYVRAVPPIVAQPNRDEDLDYVRSLVGVLSDASNLSVRVPKAELDRLRRIADRLDQVKERGDDN